MSNKVFQEIYVRGNRKVTMQELNINDKKTWYKYIPAISDDIKMSGDEFESLWSIHPNKYDQVKVFGKVYDMPRWCQSYGREYKFSGITHDALPVEHPYLKRLLAWVNEQEGIEYNQVLVNWYQDGNHNIGWHSDDEKGLEDVPIYSFSYGATRTFWIRSKHSYKKEGKTYYSVDEKYELVDNSLFIMGTGFQALMKHHVPIRKKVKDRRINITFRKFK